MTNETEITFLIHDQLSVIRNIQKNLAPVLHFFNEEERNPNEINNIYIYDKIHKNIDKIINMNNDFIELLAISKVDEEKYSFIVQVNDSFKSYLNSKDKFNPPYIYYQLNRLNDHLNLYKKEAVPNEKFKLIKKEIHEANKILCLYFLNEGIDLLQFIHDKSTNLIEEITNNSNKEYLPFDLVSLLEHAIREEKISSDLKKLEFRKNFKKPEYYVYGSKPDILRALSNLISNAIKYNERYNNIAVWIGLKIYDDADFVILEIENWGLGITEEELEKESIYEIGYRGKQALEHNIPGRGMGLSYAKNVINNSGGEIQIKSKLLPNSRYLTTTIVKLKKVVNATANSIFPSITR